MDCNCECPVRFILSRDGKPGYTCSTGRCRFFALAAVQADGYQRVLANASTPSDAVIVRLEAMLHPDTKEPCVMIKVQGNIAERRDVQAVLEHASLQPAWHTGREAYIYPMEQHRTLVGQLKGLPRVLLEDIPPFFFRCLASAKENAQRCADAADPLDDADAVVAHLKPFQRKGVEFIINHGGRGMIADDMGLGKTLQAIAVAHHYRAEWPVLVVCPMSLMDNWAKEFNRFGAIAFSRMVILQGTKARATSLHDVVIVSYSSLKSVEGISFKVVVLDESHYIKAPDTKRTQSALRLCREAKRVLLLSGTPAMSRPMELFTQLQAIHSAVMPTKTQYAARYCNAFVSRFSIDHTGHSHIDELHYLLRHFVIRRTKKELGNAGLPSKTRQLLYVYITDKERKSLERQVTALRRTMGSDGSCSMDAAGRAPNAFELKIATARAKIPAVQDYITSIVEQHLEMGEKLLIFGHHACMMDAIKSAVESVRPKQPIDYIFISGETPAVQREQLATHFREEPTCAVAILSMQSSGTGHNFTCASTVVFTELDWNPSTHLQCEDRVHRIGQSNACTIKYLLAEGTSDSVMWPLLQAKLSVTSAVLENDDEAHQLQGADTKKVSRRNLSQAAPVSTQSTLDGFLRPSQTSQSKGSGETPNSQRGSTELPLPLQSESPQGSNMPQANKPTTQASAPMSMIVSVEEMHRLKPAMRPPVTTGVNNQKPAAVPTVARTLAFSAAETPMLHPTPGRPTTAPTMSVLDMMGGSSTRSTAATAPTASTPVPSPIPSAPPPSVIPANFQSQRSPMILSMPVSTTATGAGGGGARRTTFTLSSSQQEPVSAPSTPAGTAFTPSIGVGVSGSSSSPSPVLMGLPQVATELVSTATPTSVSAVSGGGQHTLVRIPMRVGLKRRLSTELPEPAMTRPPPHECHNSSHSAPAQSFVPNLTATTTTLATPTSTVDHAAAAAAAVEAPVVVYNPLLMASNAAPPTGARTRFVWKSSDTDSSTAQH